MSEICILVNLSLLLMVTSVMNDPLVFAKQGYKLESVLNNYCIQAEIKTWNNGKEILDFVSSYQNSTQMISIFSKNKNKLAIFDFDSTIKEHPKEITYGGLSKLFPNKELPENIMTIKTGKEKSCFFPRVDFELSTFDLI